MISCRLRWSRIELSLILLSHCVALLSLRETGAEVLLRAVLTLLVLGNLAAYVRERWLVFCQTRCGDASSLHPTLQLSRDFARVSYGEEMIETAPPRVLFSSELLIVLSLHTTPTGNGSRRVMRLLLWPDSLERGAGRRLRRHLRFELVGSLEQA